MKVINKQAFLLTSKQLATVVLFMTLRFIDKADPTDPTRREDFGQILLRLAILRALITLTHTISYLLFLQFYQFPPYLQKMVIFAFLEFCLEFIIYRLFLFAISPLVRQVTMLFPSEDFFQCILVLSFVCLFCCFCLCLVTTQDIVPFPLGIVIQEIEIVQKAFC